MDWVVIAIVTAIIGAVISALVAAGVAVVAWLLSRVISGVDAKIEEVEEKTVNNTRQLFQDVGEMKVRSAEERGEMMAEIARLDERSKYAKYGD